MTERITIENAESVFGAITRVDIANKIAATWRVEDAWANDLHTSLDAQARWLEPLGGLAETISVATIQADSGNTHSRVVQVTLTSAEATAVELAQAGAQAIVRPTVEAMFPDLDNRIREVWSGHGNDAGGGSDAEGDTSHVNQTGSHLGQGLQEALGNAIEIAETIGGDLEEAGVAALEGLAEIL